MKNIFYDKSKIDYGNLLFPRRALWMLLIPLIIEQMLNSLMGMVDTLMVSRVGAEAISAVSLVDSITPGTSGIRSDGSRCGNHLLTVFGTKR